MKTKTKIGIGIGSGIGIIVILIVSFMVVPAATKVHMTTEQSNTFLEDNWPQNNVVMASTERW